MKNKLLGISLITITCLYGLLAAIVILAVMLAGGEVIFAIVGSIIVIIIQFLIAPWLTDLSMRFFYKADFNAEIPEYLKKFVEEQCNKHGVKYPKIGVIDDGGPNAFTYGRTKKDARIIVTRGIFELLNEEEVKAVVGHEMGHIVHMDMLVMTVVQIVPLILYYVFEICTRSSDSNDDNNNKAIVGYVAYILYLISQYIILWLSRTREYYADEFSVEETGNPAALAEALVKIGFGLSKRDNSTNKANVSKNNALGIFNSNAGKELAVTSMDANGNIDKNKIKSAMKWEMWNPWAKWFEFNSTHPLISKRLTAISKLSAKFNQEPYIVFDLQKTESYVDDFLIEVLISFLPIISIIVTAIIALLALSGEEVLPIVGVGLIVTVLFSFIKFKRAHKDGYQSTTVENLLGEVKVSHVTSVPCVLKGTIIGRGNPGCIFNEDFVIKDSTGIIFLDYNQPLNIMNKIFALFKSSEYFDKEVEVKGWYRRSPVPYVEIYEYTVDGKTKKIYTYKVQLALYVIALIIAFALIFLGLR